RRLLAQLDQCRHSAELELKIPNIEWRRADEIHAAARTLTGVIHRVVRMHGTNPRRLFFGVLQTQQTRNEKEAKTQGNATNNNLCFSVVVPVHVTAIGADLLPRV